MVHLELKRKQDWMPGLCIVIRPIDFVKKICWLEGTISEEIPGTLKSRFSVLMNDKTGRKPNVAWCHWARSMFYWWRTALLAAPFSKTFSLIIPILAFGKVWSHCKATFQFLCVRLQRALKFQILVTNISYLKLWKLPRGCWWDAWIQWQFARAGQVRPSEIRQQWFGL